MVVHHSYDIFGGCVIAGVSHDNGIERPHGVRPFGRFYCVELAERSFIRRLYDLTRVTGLDIFSDVFVAVWPPEAGGH